MPRPPRHRRTPARHCQGITLVEVMVAFVLAAVAFTAGAAALTSAMGGMGLSRQNQQSAELLSEIIETARGGSYAGVANATDPTAFGADGRISSSGGSYWVDPDGAGAMPTEKIVHSSTGTIPLTRTVERNGTTYTVSTYVTEPAAADASYRRVSTIVTWVRDQETHRRQATTFITNTRRGLPLPRFTISGQQDATVNASASLALPFTVTNNGARDAWNVTAATSPATGWVLAFIVDTDGDGVRDAGETTSLTDTDGDGVPDTGLLETDEVMKLLAVVDVPATQAAGTVTVTITATSSSDPAYAHSITDTVTVASQVCAGCTLTTYFMRNSLTTSADSTLQAVMPLDPQPGAAATGVPNFDSDRDASPGRTLVPGATSLTEGDASKVAVWERQMASATHLNGVATVRLYVAMKDLDPTKTGVVRIGLFQRSGNSLTQLGAAETVPLQFGDGFALVTVPITLVDAQVGKNKYLQVRVIAPAAADDLWLGYGTSGLPAGVDLPVA
ncbi:MAG: thrombospondin type 3 repeat-containing protein [Actinomycetota bacterium]